MAKNIFLTRELKDRTISMFITKMLGAKFVDDMTPFVFEQKTIDEKTVLRFTEGAWIKMQALVHTFDGEVAWRGIAYRQDDEYVVSDIIVYPQTVSSAYVDTDFDEHRDWFEQLPDDVINNMRLHGHSHVKMGVTPSAVDRTLYKQIVDQLDDDMFYIFLVVNKMGDMYIQIYDMQKNIIYERDDIDVVVEDDMGFVSFINEARELVKNKKPASSYQKSKFTDLVYDY